MTRDPSPKVAVPADAAAPKGKEAPPGSPLGVWVAASAALAVVVAIFAALGIEEDILRRMVRNFPDATATAISLVIIGASVPVVLLLIRMSRPWVTVLLVILSIVSAFLVIIGMTRVLHIGADSLNSRDMPGLSLSAVKSESGSIIVTSEATASALRSSEKMLLRIYAVGTSDSEDLVTLCRSAQEPASAVPSSGSRVLQWGEAGPDGTGAAKVSQTLTINDDDFSFVCAYAALERAPDEDGKAYLAWSVVDLRSLTFAPLEPEPTPASTIPSS